MAFLQFVIFDPKDYVADFSVLNEHFCLLNLLREKRGGHSYPKKFVASKSDNPIVPKFYFDNAAHTAYMPCVWNIK